MCLRRTIMTMLPSPTIVSNGLRSTPLVRELTAASLPPDDRDNAGGLGKFLPVKLHSDSGRWELNVSELAGELGKFMNRFGGSSSSKLPDDELRTVRDEFSVRVGHKLVDGTLDTLSPPSILIVVTGDEAARFHFYAPCLNVATHSFV